MLCVVLNNCDSLDDLLEQGIGLLQTEQKEPQSTDQHANDSVEEKQISMGMFKNFRKDIMINQQTFGGK
jgi:hypothetical protein